MPGVVEHGQPPGPPEARVERPGGRSLEQRLGVPLVERDAGGGGGGLPLRLLGFLVGDGRLLGRLGPGRPPFQFEELALLLRIARPEGFEEPRSRLEGQEEGDLAE